MTIDRQRWQVYGASSKLLPVWSQMLDLHSLLFDMAHCEGFPRSTRHLKKFFATKTPLSSYTNARLKLELKKEMCTEALKRELIYS